jgi:hypothetical protein
VSLNEKFRTITKVNNLGLLTTIVLIIIGMAIFFPRFLSPINIEILGMGFVQEAIMWEWVLYRKQLWPWE